MKIRVGMTMHLNMRHKYAGVRAFIYPQVKPLAVIVLKYSG